MLDTSFDHGGFGGSGMCACSGDTENGLGLVAYTGPDTALTVFVPSQRTTIAIVKNIAMTDDDLSGLLAEIDDLVWPAIR